MRTYNLIFTKLGPTTRVEACPYRYAWLVGACVGVASTALAVVAIGLMLVLLPREIAGPSAAASLANVGAVAALLLAVFLFPLWETFIGQLLPLELAIKIGLNDNACIAVGAAIFGASHYLNGGIAHGLCAIICGALFTTAYMALRPWGYLPAFWASYVAHALNNLLLLYAVPLVFPGLG